MTDLLPAASSRISTPLLQTHLMINTTPQRCQRSSADNISAPASHRSRYRSNVAWCLHGMDLFPICPILGKERAPTFPYLPLGRVRLANTACMTIACVVFEAKRSTDQKCLCTYTSRIGIHRRHTSFSLGMWSGRSTSVCAYLHRVMSTMDLNK